LTGIAAGAGGGVDLVGHGDTPLRLRDKKQFRPPERCRHLGEFVRRHGFGESQRR
jgi:hypothetical protein